jgi:intracellular septation protein
MNPAPLPSKPKALAPWLKLLLDLGPLAVFFATYKFANIFVATGALMAVTVVTLPISYFLTKKVPIMPLVTGVMVLVFGGLTLWLNSELFIKIKVTIIYALFAAALHVGLYLGRPFAKAIFETAFELPDACWRVLTHRFAAMFIALAGANEVVRQVLTTDDWVNFKVIGIPVLMVIFTTANMPFIMRNEIKTEGGEIKSSGPAE